MNILRSPDLPGAGQSMTPDTSNPTPDAKSGPPDVPPPASWNDSLRLYQTILTYLRDYGPEAGERLIQWINDERRRIYLGR